MAPSAAEGQSGFEPAEGTLRFCDGGGDDWVSLILNDDGLDAEADNFVSLASLSNFPLPDLDDIDFSNLDGSASSDGFTSSFGKGHHSCSDALFDPSKMLKDMEICPNLYPSANQDLLDVHPHGYPFLSHPGALVCPNLSNGSSSTKENGISQSPDSGLTCMSSDHPDTDRSIPSLDSCSDEDSLSFLVSDICSGETPSTEIDCGNAMNVPNPTNKDGYGNHVQGSIGKSVSGQSTCSENSGKPVRTDNASRKRKQLDQMSRSSMPEQMVDDCSEKVGNCAEGEDAKDEEDERRQARLMRNRESAQLSRQRKKVYVDELEEKIKTMASTIAELNNTISLISAENINLRRQLGVFGPPPAAAPAGGMANIAPWMGGYPAAPVMGNRFMVPGGQVPLVPIPRWKSQQAVPMKKTKKPKSESQDMDASPSPKSSKKTKRVAGVAAASLFFFVFILLPVNFHILGLRPMLRKESRVWSTTPWHMETSNVVVRAGARVLTGLREERDYSSQNERGTNSRFAPSGYLKAREEYWEARRSSQVPLSRTCDTAETCRKVDKSGFEMNASVPLAAALFVPRNDGLVRIEGNLVIHSVLAGDKAATTLNQSNKQSVRAAALYDRGSALRANLKALAVKAAPEERGALVDLQRALAGKLRLDADGGDIKSVKEDGSLQQWFLEDLTGPVFSSGMCTEVLQFEISPPASSSSSPGSGSGHVGDANDRAENKTSLLEGNGPRKAGRKRQSYAVPLPPVGHKVIYNATSKNGSFAGAGGYEAEKGFSKQKHGSSSSSVVVSVLAEPEFGEHSKLSGGNGLSRIFVVVLIDNVKYVTYSCMLPSSAAKSHYEVVVA